ncbi:MAG: hypothetical protein ACXWZS_05355 [Gemmatirosa sp.]
MPPDNAVYYHVAYVVVGVMYLGYAVLLGRRRARVRRLLEQGAERRA